MIAGQSSQGFGSSMVLGGSDKTPVLPLSSGSIIQIDVRETVLLLECKHLVARFDVETWLPSNPTTDAVQSALDQKKKAWSQSLNGLLSAKKADIFWLADAKMNFASTSIEFPAGPWRIPHAASVVLADYIDMPYLYSLVQACEGVDLNHLEVSLTVRDANCLKSIIFSEALDFCLSKAREKAQSRGVQLGELKTANLDITIPTWRYSSTKELAGYAGSTTAIVTGQVCYAVTPCVRKW